MFVRSPTPGLAVLEVERGAGGEGIERAPDPPRHRFPQVLREAIAGDELERQQLARPESDRCDIRCREHAAVEQEVQALGPRRMRPDPVDDEQPANPPANAKLFRDLPRGGRARRLVALDEPARDLPFGLVGRLNEERVAGLVHEYDAGTDSLGGQRSVPGRDRLVAFSANVAHAADRGTRQPVPADGAAGGRSGAAMVARAGLASGTTRPGCRD